MAAPTRLDEGTPHHFYLGESIDSIRPPLSPIPLPLGRVSAIESPNASEQRDIMPKLCIGARPRAESYDEMSTSYSKVSFMTLSSSFEKMTDHSSNNPTVDDLITSKPAHAPGNEAQESICFRRRSASCGTLPSLVNTVAFDTIAEETAYCDDRHDDRETMLTMPDDTDEESRYGR